MQGTIKEIKRAYARELKLIDLEKNPEAFQELREAYEAALKNAHQAAAAGAPEPTIAVAAVAPPPHAEPEPAPTPAPAPIQADPIPRPPALPAEEPVAKLIARLQLGIANTARGRIADDELIWKDEIRTLLEELRPVGLAAQLEFEHQVGILLLNGWRHGHEALLVAASEVFGWSEAGWRWDNLGPNGATLDAALALRHCLEHFEASERQHFRYVIRDLRQQYEPTKEALRRDLPYAEILERQFAPLFAILPPPGRVDAWRQALRKPDPAMKFRYRFAIALILLAFFYGLKWVNRDKYANHDPSPPPPPPAEIVDQSQVPKELTPAQRQMIVYAINPATWHASSPARFDVIIDSIGRPQDVILLQSSGVVAYDHAFRQALFGIQRYPADFPRRFTIER
jgi:hypothetical protein